eukprot:2846748-Prorocentrum_lima.AAC.1
MADWSRRCTPAVSGSGRIQPEQASNMHLGFTFALPPITPRAGISGDRSCRALVSRAIWLA